MATIAARRAELVAALVAATVRASDDPGAVEPPVTYIYGDGSDLVGVGRGQVRYGFRLVLVAGLREAPYASSTLGTLAELVITTLRALAGWQLGPLSADVVRTIAGGEYLTADLSVSTMVDL